MIEIDSLDSCPTVSERNLIVNIELSNYMSALFSELNLTSRNYFLSPKRYSSRLIQGVVDCKYFKELVWKLMFKDSPCQVQG